MKLIDVKFKSSTFLRSFVGCSKNRQINFGTIPDSSIHTDAVYDTCEEHYSQMVFQLYRNLVYSVAVAVECNMQTMWQIARTSILLSLFAFLSFFHIAPGL